MEFLCLLWLRHKKSRNGQQEEFQKAYGSTYEHTPPPLLYSDAPASSLGRCVNEAYRYQKKGGKKLSQKTGQISPSLKFRLLINKKFHLEVTQCPHSRIQVNSQKVMTSRQKRVPGSFAVWSCCCSKKTNAEGVIINSIIRFEFHFVFGFFKHERFFFFFLIGIELIFFLKTNQKQSENHFSNYLKNCKKNKPFTKTIFFQTILKFFLPIANRITWDSKHLIKTQIFKN